MKLPNPKVTQPTAKNIAAHFQSPLNNGTKKPKKKFVHEKPTGASLSCWFFYFLMILVQKPYKYV